MPVGNSITHGVGDDAGEQLGYRDHLYSYLSGYGTFEFVGPNGTDPYKGNFQAGANIIDFLQTGTKNLTLAIQQYHPDILLIHIGTNDANSSVGTFSSSGTANQMYRLLTEAHNAMSTDATRSEDWRIIVCKILPKYNNGVEITNVNSFNKQLEEMMFSGGMINDRITLLDMNSLLDTSDFSDQNIHPGDAGYNEMAKLFAGFIRGSGPTNGIITPDETSPGKISDLRALKTNDESALLKWSAPGDNGYSGKALLYELRYSEDPDGVENNFSEAALISLDRPSDSGETENRSVTNLEPGSTYYFRVRAYDEHNNASKLSNTATVDLTIPETGNLVCDTFETDSSWSYDTGVYQISPGSLCNISQNSGWKSLAIYEAASYDADINFVETAITWSTEAIPNSRYTGIALLLDSKEPTNANGYMVRLNSDYNLDLYRIVNGTPTGIMSVPSFVQDDIKTEDILSVRFTKSITSFSFLVSLNGTLIGQLIDTNPNPDVSDNYYSGVVLFGAPDGVNNCLSNFCVEIPVGRPDNISIVSGDSSLTRVGETQSLPLKVKVTDKNGFGVKNIPIEFTTTSNNLQLSTDYDKLAQEFNGNIWIEAENGILTSPMTTISSSEASEGAYIVPQGENKEGYAHYKVLVPKTGTYKAWVRGLGPGDTSNSCYFGYDDIENKNEIKFSTSAEWEWKESITTTLNAGIIDMYINTREAQTRIDKILLTSNSSIPVDKGETNQQFPNVTDQLGLAYTEVTFGEEAGWFEIYANTDLIQPNGSVMFAVSAAAGDPFAMAAYSSRRISGSYSTQLSEPFQVQIIDQYNNNVSGVPVTFQVLDGGGTFGFDKTEIISKSNQEGIASAILTLGTDTLSTVKVYIKSSPTIQPITFEGVINTIASNFDIVNAQTRQATVHTKLDQTLDVKISDGDLLPIENYIITFTVTSGNGFLENDTLFGQQSIQVRTDASGIARATYTVGDTAGVGKNNIEASSGFATLLFNINAGPDVANKFVLQGDNQEQFAGQTFTDSLKASVLDLYGNGISNQSIQFQVLTGDGNFAGNIGVSTSNATANIITNTRGIASTSYTAGTTTGNNSIKLTNQTVNIPESTFTNLLVKTATVAEIKKIAGDQQNAVVKSTLGIPLKIQLLDPFNMPVVGELVEFVSVEPKNNLGSFSSGTSFSTNSNTNGEAQVTFKLGEKAIAHKVIVSTPNVPNIQPAEFTLFANPGSAVKLAIIGPANFEGIASKDTSELALQVRDIYDNPISNVSVTYNIQTGGGQFVDNNSVAITNFEGIAQLGYIMGEKSGNVEIKASMGSISPVSFFGTILPDQPERIENSTGLTPQGKILTQLVQPLKITLYDQYNNVVPHTRIKSLALSKSGKIIGDSVQTTDNSGQATIHYQLGSQAGEKSDTIRVSLENNSEVNLELYATALAGQAFKISPEKSDFGTIQLAPVMQPLVPKAKVMDEYNNPVEGHKVMFYNTGLSYSEEKTSDANGWTFVNWQLDETSGQQSLFARSMNAQTNQDLQNSPLEFLVLTKSGEAAVIEYANGASESITGPGELSVKVTDIQLFPVPDHHIIFRTDAAGTFISHGDSSTSEIEITTDENGVAKVFYIPALGNNIITTRSISPNIEGPPFRVTGLPATATIIQLANLPQAISDTVAHQITVQVSTLDQFGNKAQGQLVQFQAFGTNSYLNSNGKISQKGSDINGIASIQWTLGTQAGQNSDTLRITASVNGVPLANSPLLIVASTSAGVTFPDSSIVNSSGGTVGQGISVNIFLKDKYGNPAGNRNVELVKHDHVTSSIAIPKTNNKGQTIAFVTFEKAGQFQLQFMVKEQSDILLKSTSIHIATAPASLLQIISGNNQNANPGAALKEKLFVETTDSYGNQVDNTIVKFTSAKGKFAENNSPTFTTLSDSGFATAHFIAANQPNTSYSVSAEIVGLPATLVTFSGQIKSNVSNVIFAQTTQDTLEGKPGNTVGPFELTVLDSDSIPIWDRSILFEPDPESGGSIVAGKVKSDPFGKVQTNYTIGTRKVLQPITAKDELTGLEMSFFARGEIGRPFNISASPIEELIRVTDEIDLIAIVTDSVGIGVEGIEVQFALIGEETHNARFINETKSITNEDGHALIRLKVGEKVGTYQIESFAIALPGKKSTFYIQTKPDWPTKIIEINNYQYGKIMTVGWELLEPIVINVMDDFQNPIPGATVSFFADGNNGEFIGGEYPVLYSDLTDDNGNASCRWKLGTPGENSIIVNASYNGNSLPQRLTITATGVENNFPRFSETPPDTIVLDYSDYLGPGALFNLNVHATDDDGDPITYTVESIPASATFDETSHIFSWKPGASDKSAIWPLKIIATDNKLGIDRGTGLYQTNLKVVGNSAPIVTPFPETNSSIRILDGEIKTFRVEATDLDGDTIFYWWWLDGNLVASGPTASSYTIRYNDVSLDFHELRCQVNDNKGHDVYVTWSAIKVKVELSKFEASSLPFNGIRLDWHTIIEEDNLGFNVLKSQRKDGQYKQINSSLLSPQKDGYYSYIDSTADAGVNYYYKLVDVNKNGFKGEHGPITISLSVPDRFEISQNYPNPFNPETKIRFQLPTAAATKIVIYNITGQEVKTLIDADVKAGYHIVKWDGRNNNQLRAGSGIYYYRIIAGEYTAIKKMVLVR